MNIEDVEFGLWIDDPKTDVLSDGYFRTLRDHHIESIAVMIDPSDAPWNPSWSEEEIERLMKLAEPADIGVSLVTWPYPCRDQIDTMSTDMLRLMAVGVPESWEVDVEFNWKARYLDGFDSIDEAGDYLVEAMTDVCDTLRCNADLTTFMEHTENGRAADVAPHMDTLWVQAYSVAKRNGRDIPGRHRYGPGRMQRRTYGRTLTVPGVDSGQVAVGMGLAAWSQHFDVYAPDVAMSIALHSAMNLGIRRVRWWSSKHVLGAKANPYAGKFIRGLKDGDA